MLTNVDQRCATAFREAELLPFVNSGTESAPAEVTLLRATELTAPVESSWINWQRRNPQPGHCYFHPAFFQAVARVRRDVELASICVGGKLVALFPFQRVKPNVAHPVGGHFNDFHGVVLSPEFPGALDIEDVLRQCRLRYVPCHALVPQAAVKGGRAFARLPSPFIDTRGTWDAYLGWLRGNSTALRRQPQKERRMERQLGPLRLELDILDAAVLETVIRWKREKFRRTRTFDILSVDWTTNLLREVFSTSLPDFRGLLSGLWAGDHLVAAHFGMLSGNTLHYWFPAYDEKFARYSPGNQLLKEMVRACIDRGIERIDLGYGRSPLKDRFANGATTVVAGCFALSDVDAWVGCQRYRFREALRRAPFRHAGKRLVRAVAPGFGRNVVR